MASMLFSVTRIAELFMMWAWSHWLLIGGQGWNLIDWNAISAVLGLCTLRKKYLSVDTDSRTYQGGGVAPCVLELLACKYFTSPWLVSLCMCHLMCALHEVRLLVWWWSPAGSSCWRRHRGSWITKLHDGNTLEGKYWDSFTETLHAIHTGCAVLYYGVLKSLLQFEKQIAGERYLEGNWLLVLKWFNILICTTKEWDWRHLGTVHTYLSKIHT